MAQSKKRKVPDTCNDLTKNSVEEAFLSGIKAFVMKAGIQKARIQIFVTQLEKFGAIVHNEILPTTTHILVDESIDVGRTCRLLKLDCVPKTCVVKTTWLSTCLRQKKLIQTQEFELDLMSYFNAKSVCSTAVESTSDVCASASSGSAVQTMPNDTSKFNKTGIMFNAFTKSNKQDLTDDSDSDYVVSVEEQDEDESGYHSPSTSSTEAVTPNISPAKAFPVRTTSPCSLYWNTWYWTF